MASRIDRGPRRQHGHATLDASQLKCQESAYLPKSLGDCHVTSSVRTTHAGTAQ
jgi:hypothetical protein